MQLPDSPGVDRAQVGRSAPERRRVDPVVALDREVTEVLPFEHGELRREEVGQRIAWVIGVDVKVVLMAPCIFCMENP